MSPATESPQHPRRSLILAEFGQFFMGRLWDVYAERVLSSAPF